MLGLIGLITANQSSLQQKITMQERDIYVAPTTFFLGSASFFIQESPLVFP